MACAAVPILAKSMVRKAKAASWVVTGMVKVMITLPDCTSMSTTEASTLAAVAKFCLISPWWTSG